MIETLDQLADALVAGHDGGSLIAGVPDHLVPADTVAIYALQDKVISQLGAIGGWKIAAGADEPFCAPIPASRYFANDATLDAGRARFVIAEIEVAVTLQHDIHADADASAVERAVGSLHLAIEMVGSPFVDRDAIAPNVKLGDLQSNGAVIVGPALPTDVGSPLSTLPIALLLDGQEVKSTRIGAGMDDIVAALVWLAKHAAARGLPLAAGQVIITGARIAAPQDGAKKVEGRSEGWESVTAKLS